MEKNLDEKTINKIIKEADKNDYLFSLLYVCYSNGLRISECNIGDREKHIYPSVSFILEYDNLEIYKNIIGILEDIPDVIVNTTYDISDTVDYKDKKLLTVTMFPYNRDEVFYKLSCIYDIKKDIEDEKNIVFFNRLYNFIVSGREELEYKIHDGIIVCHRFDTLTDELIKYEKNNKNILWRLLYYQEFNKYSSEECDKKPLYKIKEY